MGIHPYSILVSLVLNDVVFPTIEILDPSDREIIDSIFSESHIRTIEGYNTLLAKTATDVIQNLALVFEPKGALDGVIKALESPSKGAKGCSFTAVLDMAIIDNFHFD
jgi:hypothetical protein